MAKRKKNRRRSLDYSKSGQRAQLERVFKRDNGICQICQLPCQRKDASREHVITLQSGGARTDDNVILAHKLCNNTRNEVNYNPWPNFIAKGIRGALYRQVWKQPIVQVKYPSRPSRIVEYSFIGDWSSVGESDEVL